MRIVHVRYEWEVGAVASVLRAAGYEADTEYCGEYVVRTNADSAQCRVAAQAANVRDASVEEVPCTRCW